MELQCLGPPSRTLAVNSRTEENAGQALTQAVREVAFRVCKDCYLKSDEHQQAKVKRTIQRWRLLGRVWVSLGHRFCTEVIHSLLPLT